MLFLIIYKKIRLFQIKVRESLKNTKQNKNLGSSHLQEMKFKLRTEKVEEP